MNSRFYTWQLDVTHSDDSELMEKLSAPELRYIQALTKTHALDTWTVFYFRRGRVGSGGRSNRGNGFVEKDKLSLHCGENHEGFT